MSDVFSNLSNDYIYPALSPCPNVADNQYLVWTEEGLAIIKGSQEIAIMEFDDLQIPVNSFNKQQITLGAGEITFIPGLAKGLCNRSQSFTMPSLDSSSLSLNQYFFKVDLSVNYYKNFSYTYSNIDSSGNYSENISIDDDLSLKFNNSGIKITASYDPSILTFTGNQKGYDFVVSNVKLTIIDASENSNSPFAQYANASTYELEEDVSLKIDYAKYPNTAMQGIILRGIYPSEYNDIILCDEDKWFYLNHVSDYVTTCDPMDVSYNTDVSVGLIIEFDSSIFIGTQPNVSLDVSLNDASCYIYTADTSISITDASTTYNTSTYIIDSSTVTWRNIFDCSISDSSISDSNIYDSSIFGSFINDSYILGIIISDSSITGTYVSDSSSLNNLYINQSNLQNSTIVDASTIASSTILQSVIVGESSSRIISAPTLSDSSIINYIINSGTAINSYFKSSSISNIDSSTSIFDDSSIWNSEIYLSEILCSIIKDSSISQSFIANSDVSGGDILDVSVYDSMLIDTSIYQGQFQDSSIYESIISKIETNNISITDSNIRNSILGNTIFSGTTINDVSIINDSIINNDSSISNSYMANIWTNSYVLIVNPSTGEKIYVTGDDTLSLDASFNRVNIYNSIIWDGSLNNAIIYDSSLYNCWFQDTSLIRCTTYNCDYDVSVYADPSTRDILVDPSISCAYEITSDSSTFYLKHKKKLEIGMSGCSVDDLLSAGDYLNLITKNNMWKKIGDMYIWTSAPDPNNCTEKNLIDGFYAYNPHTFSVQVEYMVFV